MRPRLPIGLLLVLLVVGQALAVDFLGSGAAYSPNRTDPPAPPTGPPAPPLFEEPRMGDPVVLERADVMRTIDLGGRIVRELQGNVRVLHRGRVFDFQLGRYDREAGLLTCTGQVRVTEGERVLTADEVSYDELRETVRARGNVHSWGDSLEAWADKGFWYNGLEQGELQVQARLLDLRRKVELRAGQVEADHRQGVYTATRAPELTLQEEPPTTLHARHIQWRRSDSLAIARREVRLTREDFEAKCDSLIWHENQDRMEFLLSPVLIRERQKVVGERIEALLRDGRQLDSLWVQGRARMESPADSVSSLLFDVLEGRRMEFAFVDEQLVSVYVEGQARSVIFHMDERGRPGMNVADAARMWFRLKDQALETVQMSGGMEARWVPLKEPPRQTPEAGGRATGRMDSPPPEEEAGSGSRSSP
ncbi:MAG: hypothetical protein Q8O14_01355 [bacterium]|nr:hypothetical protein [bacterium]